MSGPRQAFAAWSRSAAAQDAKGRAEAGRGAVPRSLSPRFQRLSEIPGRVDQPATHQEHQCLIRLGWDGRTLERSLLLPGHDRWLSRDLRAPAALELLDVWRPSDPFDGDLLFELLFGADSDLYQDLLADPWGAGSATPAAPTRWPWRIRLLIDAGSPLLHCLPWTLISHTTAGSNRSVPPGACASPTGRAAPAWT